MLFKITDQSMSFPKIQKPAINVEYCQLDWWFKLFAGIVQGLLKIFRLD